MGKSDPPLLGLWLGVNWIEVIPTGIFPVMVYNAPKNEWTHSSIINGVTTSSASGLPHAWVLSGLHFLDASSDIPPRSSRPRYPWAAQSCPRSASPSALLVGAALYEPRRIWLDQITHVSCLVFCPKTQASAMNSALHVAYDSDELTMLIRSWEDPFYRDTKHNHHHICYYKLFYLIWDIRIRIS